MRVKLTGADGKPVTGAQVTVTFFMAAMPAMGMAAMRDVAALADKGNGLYEGPLQLQSGGTWQVTITVQRGGQTIATKQLSRQRHGRHVMISRIIEWCERNRFLVFTGAILLTLAGAWCVQRVPLDALPDISDVQVIIHTEWAGEPPNVIEDQVTYPIVSSLLAAPQSQSRSRPDDVWRFLRLCRVRGWNRPVLGAFQGDGVSATDRGQAASRCASCDRTGRNRRGLGVRVCHR